MKKLSFISAVIFSTLLFSCSKESLETPQNKDQGSGQDAAASRTGIPNQQAYYDAQLFTINLLELSDQAAASVIAHNSGLNEIYASEDLDDPQTFHPVIDAVPADGFNPMWLQFLIVFNTGYTPHQFFSDDEIETAEANGEITLINTGEVYRCAVISH